MSTLRRRRRACFLLRSVVGGFLLSKGWKGKSTQIKCMDARSVAVGLPARAI
jgi:hypothetical protein